MLKQQPLLSPQTIMCNRQHRSSVTFIQLKCCLYVSDLNCLSWFLSDVYLDSEIDEKKELLIMKGRRIKRRSLSKRWKAIESDDEFEYDTNIYRW